MLCALQTFFSPLKWHHLVETPRRCQHFPLNLRHVLFSSFFPHSTTVSSIYYQLTWCYDPYKSKQRPFDQWPGFIGLLSYSAFEPLSWVVLWSHRDQDVEGCKKKKKKKVTDLLGFQSECFGCSAEGHSHVSCGCDQHRHAEDKYKPSVQLEAGFLPGQSLIGWLVGW